MVIDMVTPTRSRRSGRCIPRARIALAAAVAMMAAIIPPFATPIEGAPPQEQLGLYGQEGEVTSWNGLTHIWRQLQRTEGDCSQSYGVWPACAVIAFEYPEFVEAPSQAALESLNQWVTETLAAGAASPEERIEVLLEEFRRGNARALWRHKSIHVLYQDRQLSVTIQFFEENGPAVNVANDAQYANFDLQTGARLQLDSVFVPGFEESLLELIEDDLRGGYIVPEDQTLGEAGFDFWLGDRLTQTLPLPTEWSIREFGMEFHYGEARSHGDGPIVAFISYEELHDLLRDDGVLGHRKLGRIPRAHDSPGAAAMAFFEALEKDDLEALRGILVPGRLDRLGELGELDAWLGAWRRYDFQSIRWRFYDREGEDREIAHVSFYHQRGDDVARATLKTRLIDGLWYVDEE